MADSYKIQLEDVFEGPMDLLLHLIKKNEVDIYDIPIALITRQYLEYLEWMKAIHIEFAGDFIVMAATLAQIKSRMLLPAYDGQEDEDEEERGGGRDHGVAAGAAHPGGRPARNSPRDHRRHRRRSGDDRRRDRERRRTKRRMHEHRTTQRLRGRVLRPLAGLPA